MNIHAEKSNVGASFTSKEKRGRPKEHNQNEKQAIYLDLKARGIGNYKVSTGIYDSLLPVQEFSLQDFANIGPLFCSWKHNTGSLCKECSALIEFGQSTVNEWLVELATCYKVLFPLVKYKAEQAIRKLMQMLVTILQMTLNAPGSQKLYVS